MMETRAETKSLIFQFDNFEVDPLAFRLSKDGVPIDLEPKALHLLIYFVENRGRLLKKQELLEAIWADAAVTENALTREIAILRRVLSDSTKASRYVETVPTQGYRFVAQVSSAEREQVSTPKLEAGSEPVAPLQSPNRRFRVPWLLIPVGMLLVIGILTTTLLYRARLNKHGDGAGEESPRLRLVQLTFSGGLDGFPSFSRDGRSVVFSSDRTGVFELYVRQVDDNGGEIQLTRDAGGNIQPSWSPNGQWVAYHSLKNGGIWVVPALGGTPRRITDFGSEPSWSHDGTRIAFQSGELGGITEAHSGAMPGSTIWIAQLHSNEVWQVTHLSYASSAEAFYGDGSPRWSSDDRRVLFENSGQLWTTAVDGSNLRSVRIDRAASDPILGEDDRSLYFLGQDAEGSGLWKVQLNDNLEAAGPSVRVHNSAPASARYLAVGTGNRFAFSIVNTHDNLYSLSLTPAGTAGTPFALTQDTRLRKTRPLFSPDGLAISFLVGQRGRSGQLWVVDPEGKTPTQIPVNSPAYDADWCEVDVLCYWSMEGRNTLWRWDLKQGRPEPVLRTPEKLSALRVSPDGTTGAFQNIKDGAMNVWTISLRTGKVQPVTAGGGVIGWPAWSRDSSTLAVEIRDRENTQIGIVPASGGKPVCLTHGAGQNWPFSWSPHSTSVAFAGSRGGVWNVYSVSRTSGAIQQLTHYNSQSSFVRYPDWSPNGKQIVYEFGASTANIWLLEPRK
jgi:Tol biopolymer transport system component/DNA-binding winged helix-turn-helix (wHTH) protein